MDIILESKSSSPKDLTLSYMTSLKFSFSESFFSIHIIKNPI